MSLGKKLEKRLPLRLRWLCRAIRTGDVQPDARISHAQEGEDLALLRYFRNRSRGFYVDVGAHHPTRFSNTWAFYQRGWSGINVDPLPGTATAFSTVRPRDITLEAGVSDHVGELIYHQFKEPAFNTFSPSVARAAEAKGARTIGTISVSVDTLTSILDRHLPPGRHIDFMTIDVEGFDEAVIRSLDFSKYRPEVLIVEMIGANIEEVLTSNLYISLREKNYRAHAKTGNSVILVDQVPRGEGLQSFNLESLHHGI